MENSIVDHHLSEPSQRPKWKISWLETIAALMILAGLVTFLYPTIASWFSQKEQSRVTALALNKMDEPPGNDANLRKKQIDLAHEYNKALASGAIYRANENIVHSDTRSETTGLEYNKLLNASGDGFMGRLRYDALDIDLPIYHGTDDETLRQGIGHLEGTSLPVGGLETRSVLTAHRGLPESTLFTHLDRAKVGDKFSISVLDHVITYQVTDMVVIDPEETEAILPVAGTDMITLVTCTPLGINSHRILVNAERVTPTPIEDVKAAEQAPEIPGFPWWAVILGSATVGSAVVIWWSGRGRLPKS
ncbi:class C sortase [Glutamicibacter nicotianae]|uniref:class C sortase n=1 Tax=Glutamicibacter nicotianae TaxID=37929 RepID=UPI0025532B1E|nr:class C sortase [Glutamicibacter nicotianae]WIV45351.1 class C sortase [Glutamicibacter nicotianae]